MNDGKIFRPGDTLRQPELAATLKRIAKNGAGEFYTGDTAHVVVDDITKYGGLISLDDLANYKPKVREVLRAQYSANDRDGRAHSWDVLTSPPPSSGGVAIIEAMNMLQSTPLKGWDDIESVHMVAETMQRVFADRAAYLADPDYSDVPVAGLTSPCYAKERAATIDSQSDAPQRCESRHAAHLRGGCRDGFSADDRVAERRPAHDAFLRRRCRRKRRRQHVHAQRQLRLRTSRAPPASC